MKGLRVCFLPLIIIFSIVSLCSCENVSLKDTHITHEYKISTKLPTCTEKGYDLYKCDCGKEYKDNYINSLGHDLTEWEKTLAPTYEAKGEQKRTCKRENCTYFESQEILQLTNERVISKTKWEEVLSFISSQPLKNAEIYYYDASSDVGEYTIFEVFNSITYKKEYYNNVISYEAYYLKQDNVSYIYYKHNGNFIKQEHLSIEQDLMFLNIPNTILGLCVSRYDNFTFNSENGYYVGEVVFGGGLTNIEIIFSNEELVELKVIQGSFVFKLSKIGSIYLELPEV